MKYIKITHDFWSTEGGENTYTFKFNQFDQISDVSFKGCAVICRTARGVKLGRIVDIIDSASINFTPTATAEFINNDNRNELCEFDQAQSLVSEGFKPEDTIEKIFNGYTDCRAAEAFAYKLIDECSYVDWMTYLGARYMRLWRDYENGSCSVYKEICFG